MGTGRFFSRERVIVMKYIGAVFFDSDGTLTDDKAGIFEPTAKTVEALKKLEQNGYLAVLCTGRALPYADTAKYFNSAIFSSGSYAICGSEVVFDNPIESDLLADMLKFMDSCGMVYMLDNPKLCYCNDKSSAGFNEWADRFKISKAVFADDKLPDRVHKIGAMFKSEEQAERMRELFGEYVCVDFQHGILYADVYERNLSKGDAVKKFIEYMDIPRECTCAFGDGANDVTMLQAVAHGVAMGVHSDKLDGVCEFVTETVANEGISLGLERLGLI